ncbi:leucyl aminopeptidase [Salinibacterium sp. SWN139]|uniref:leucyl aminopeptidase n=1 Tax=Salinibacterium sp. SWN139 TaxID=2792055 RepID=UPI0018CED87B|nr:leucyl aminopeptidase [Salinibacterium sp. SWN139]MBH0054077.1 leucyl aminopeptidase [Salinibacterium sp. SWN139]
MTVATLHLSTAPASEVESDVLVIGVVKTDTGPKLVDTSSQLATFEQALSLIGATGAADELHRIPAIGIAAPAVAFIGLGDAIPTAESLRYAAGSAARQLRGAPHITLSLGAESSDETLAVLEGAAIGAYSYDAYRSTAPDASKKLASDITIVSPIDDAALIERANVIAYATHVTRDMVNEAPKELYPATFADRATELASLDNVEVEVYAEKELEEGGFGGILGVGQGSTRGPRLVKISYTPSNAAKHLALVGKGITFDSGGLSLKPGLGMIGMKFDMSGAATVMAVVEACAKLGTSVRLTAWLCLAENMPSGSAIRPNDVLTIRGGKTVEVLNTDAEGRLVMADGLVAASEENPDAIVDIATLTGAAVVALGNRYAGTMGDKELVNQVVAVADRVGEPFWAMPISPELRPLLASDIADIANIKPGNTAGGMLIAAAFLKDFVGKRPNSTETIPWAHIDIAGPSDNRGGGWGYVGKGATGIGVRTLIELAEEFSRP